MNIQKTEQSAHQNAKAKVEFKIHLINYIVINTILAVINLTLTPGYMWFVWPLLGWGIGIFAHGINVHFSTISSLKERMIEKEMKKEKQFR